MEANEFSKLVDKVEIKHAMFDIEVTKMIPLSTALFRDYYMGKKEAPNGIIERLKQIYEQPKEEKEYNFKELVEAIRRKHLISFREIADKLGITDVLFYMYYNGSRTVPEEIINELKNLSDWAVKKEDVERIQKRDRERYLYTTMINRLYKLNPEHKQEVYNLIQTYTDDEEIQRLTMTSKETN